MTPADVTPANEGIGMYALAAGPFIVFCIVAAILCLLAPPSGGTKDSVWIWYPRRLPYPCEGGQTCGVPRWVFRRWAYVAPCGKLVCP